MINLESVVRALRLFLMTVGFLTSLSLISYTQGHINLKQYILPATATLISGATDGLNQALQFRYTSVKRTFTGMNDHFWDPAQSWMNKYKNGDPAQGAKFLGSTTYLVFMTDGYHLTRFIEHMFNAGAVALYITRREKKKWYIYVAEIVGGWLINRAGFALVYDRFKKY